MGKISYVDQNYFLHKAGSRTFVVWSSPAHLTTRPWRTCSGSRPITISMLISQTPLDFCFLESILPDPGHCQTQSAFHHLRPWRNRLSICLKSLNLRLNDKISFWTFILPFEGFWNLKVYFLKAFLLQKCIVIVALFMYSGFKIFIVPTSQDVAFSQYPTWMTHLCLIINYSWVRVSLETRHIS